MAEQRASDSDRERAADHLRRAGGDGRLTVDELDERVQAAYEARTRTELERLLDDVAEEHAPVVRKAATAGGVAVRPGPGGSRWILSVMSGATREGRWRMSERCTVVNVMGGSDLDLNDVELAGEDVTLTVFSLMGGADIYVPEDVRVEVSSVGIMGGNDVDAATTDVHGGPVIRVKLISIMGGANVRRGRKQSWRERRDARRLAKREEQDRRHAERDELQQQRRDLRR